MLTEKESKFLKKVTNEKRLKIAIIASFSMLLILLIAGLVLFRKMPKLILTYSEKAKAQINAVKTQTVVEEKLKNTLMGSFKLYNGVYTQFLYNYILTSLFFSIMIQIFFITIFCKDIKLGRIIKKLQVNEKDEL